MFGMCLSFVQVASEGHIRGERMPPYILPTSPIHHGQQSDDLNTSQASKQSPWTTIGK